MSATVGAFPTREQAYGVSGRTLAARSRRKLKAVRKLLPEIEAPWAEVDNTVAIAADELRAACDEFDEELERAIEYLKSEVGT